MSDARAPGLRERKKQQTGQHIAETARRLFTRRGFEAVTVTEVARAAGLATQTVFNYFPTKEDLVYWQLESFEDELLAAVREREAGESVLAAFGRFVRRPRGMLAHPDPAVREQLAELTRVIIASPALRAREQQVFARYTAALGELIADEQGAGTDEIQAKVAANAMMGMHRALVDFARARILHGASDELPDELRAHADRALALLERGLGNYAKRH